ncbi:hypothetical protein CHK_0576 [Christensenella hongkongensis]|uniref:Uncharacterized protein n=1 Tax=Christensenella hongkongensis TaxID=270498 RepID=A0A0M2NI93_9FIRM|nr:hypothetical protein CHK_0576 [Christensenella hongkongensis]
MPHIGSRSLLFPDTRFGVSGKQYTESIRCCICRALIITGTNGNAYPLPNGEALSGIGSGENTDSNGNAKSGE